MTPDDLDATLETARRSTAPIDPAFADRLEARLTTVHGALGDTDDAAAPRIPRPWRRAVLAAACLLVVVAAVAWAAPSSPDRELTLDAASDARVVLPDGSVVAAEAGLVLPDGTTITAGDEPLMVGGRLVAPGETVVIRDGRVLSEGPTDGTAAAPDPPGDDRPPPDPTTTRPRSDPTVADPPPTVVTAPPPRPVPTSPSTTTRPSTTTTRPAEPAPLSLRAARGPDRGVGLSWSAFTGGAFARVVVVRTISTSDAPPPRPVGPSDGQGVFSSTDQRAVAARDTLPPGAVSGAYRVFVLDEAGAVLALSNIAAA